MTLNSATTLFLTGVEEKNTRYDANIKATHTVDGAANTPVFNSFYQLLNSQRIMDQDVDIKTDMYQWMRQEEMKGKVVSLDRVFNQQYFSWTDNWCGEEQECATKQHLGGLSLEQEKKYDIYVSCSGTPTVNYFTTLVTTKQMMISPAGVQVM